MAGTTFKVMKQKTTSNGTKTYHQVGTVIIRANGESGVLFLNWLDGDFLLMPKAKKDTESAAET